MINKCPFWRFIFLLLCGDIDVNPGLGPDSVEDSISSCETLSATSFETLSNQLCIIPLNIQSIAPKIDIHVIRREADAYDIPVFSESWLKPNITDETIKIEIHSGQKGPTAVAEGSFCMPEPQFYVNVELT